MQSLDLLHNDASLSTIPRGQGYIEHCKANGVPVPEDGWWTDKWTGQSPFTTKFIRSELEAEVWTYISTTPRGTCLALTRFASGSSTASTIGIICQGNDSNKACYWDADEMPRSTPTSTPAPLSAWRGGADLVTGNGVCTDCHAGENAFVVHPGEFTRDFRTKHLQPMAWIGPLVDESWGNNPNPGPSSLLDGWVSESGVMCSQCHDTTPGRRGFPEVSTALPGYCQQVLAKSFASSGTMPPGPTPGDQRYRPQVDTLLTACQTPPDTNRVACSVFDDDYTNLSAPSEAIFFNQIAQPCIPDEGSGTCRKWFGRCASTSDKTPVLFEVFNDAETARTPPSDAIFARGEESVCIPDAGNGTCRRWFGIGRTADDHAVECYLFNDGFSDRVGPTTAIYYHSRDRVCMPDGTFDGTCRKWFGNCQITGRPAPPRIQPPQPPSEARTECLRACAVMYSGCGQGGSVAQCIARANCRRQCPSP
jgi:hypothetical protein